MTHLQIIKSPLELCLNDYTLKGEPVKNQIRLLKDVSGIFLNQEALSELNPETPVYVVQAWLPVTEGTPGGLFFGASTIMAGKVGNEYFMTKGHFHLQSDRAEFYWCVKGKGMLILMDRDRNTWAEQVYPGSLHYIEGEVAHRLANTGDENLVVGACWPSDAGHEYEQIAQCGFSARLLEMDGEARLFEIE